MTQLIDLLQMLLYAAPFVTLITFFVTRKDNKDKDESEILKKLNTIEKHENENYLTCTRNELLILMNHYGSEKREILRVAEKYFVELKGDFYMTSLFSKWLIENNVERPNWFFEHE